MRNFKLLMALAACAVAAPAIASTQGTPGPTSTGTVTINASITPEVNISNLDDFTFTATQLATAVNTGRPAGLTDDICLWTNNVDNTLFVTATGDGAGGAFTLTDGSRTLPYSVTLRVIASQFQLTPGTKTRPIVISNAGVDCSAFRNGTNASLAIILQRDDIAAMEATTTYTGVLTLLVSPT
ncbi:hypothetical protein [Erythrobacter dokdonensis]|uniref:Uncharacterized protein n=1 Tax=Erythrobacter dokdonensis DSW-74 TaxID=1300349 RepID=A0A1A7BFQ8_9SPHN|nr:hypothetical protein [Erythrobacter dokdonensis]OBV10581.1 hypothetical protein I603_1794 [Erythrobacter dokdonensis DSW-74]